MAGVDCEGWAQRRGRKAIVEQVDGGREPSRIVGWLKYPGLTQWMDAQARDKGGVSLSARASARFRHIGSRSGGVGQRHDSDGLSPLSGRGSSSLARGACERGARGVEGDQRGRGGLRWPTSASSRIIPNRDPRAARLSLDGDGIRGSSRLVQLGRWTVSPGGMLVRGTQTWAET